MKVGEITPVAAGLPAVEPIAATSLSRHEAAEKRAIVAAVRELELPELNLPNRGLSIEYDRETRQSIVQIVDKDSGEVVQQFPAKDVVERARYYRELSGL
jgi:uncharacterized FlaG/YvyC family protein